MTCINELHNHNSHFIGPSGLPIVGRIKYKALSLVHQACTINPSTSPITLGPCFVFTTQVLLLYFLLCCHCQIPTSRSLHAPTKSYSFLYTCLKRSFPKQPSLLPNLKQISQAILSDSSLLFFLVTMVVSVSFSHMYSSLLPEGGAKIKTTFSRLL